MSSVQFMKEAYVRNNVQKCIYKPKIIKLKNDGYRVDKIEKKRGKMR